MPAVESSDTEETHIEYRSVQTGANEWTVFCLDDREPEWWRVIAVFSSAKRAESYAEIEMMMIEENSPEEIGAIADGVHGHVPNSAQPLSSIIRSNFVRRESVEHIRIEREETETVMVAQPEEPRRIPASPPFAAPQADPVQESDEDGVLPPAVDCATLDPLTPIQFQVFSVICAARGEHVPGTKLNEITKNGGAASAVYPLVRKGYLRARSIGGGRNAYDVICFGAPRTIPHATHPHTGKASGRALKVEPDAEIAPEPEPPPPEAAPEAPESTELTDQADEIDADDLSKGPREVLCIVCELHADKVHPIKEPDILALSEADESRLAFILNRLRGLRCVQRDSVGSYFPTSLGVKLAKEIKEQESA